MKLRVENNPHDLAVALSEILVDLSNSNQECINISLSGGSTPKLWFKLLKDEYADKIAWHKFHFYWGDERCVPIDLPESNAGEAKRLLFNHIDIPTQNIHSVLGENNPAEEALRYSEEITTNLLTNNKLPSFDIIILGMGEDGHTASIFPYEIELLESENVCEVATHPESGQKRITITGKVLNNAKRVIFLAAGASKAEKLKEIANKEASSKSYPAAYITNNVEWFIDNAAASLIV